MQEERAKGNHVLMFSGMQNRALHVTLNFTGSGPHAGYLAEISQLVPAAKLLQARSPLAVPVHQGDRLVSFQKIEL